MAAPDSSAPDGQRLEALTKQLDELERKSGALVQAVHRSSQIRLLLALAVVVVLGVSLFAFWSRASAFLSKPDPLKNELQRWADSNRGELENEARALLKHVKDPVWDAFSGRFQEDMPIYMTKAGEQREILADRLRDKLQAKVNDKYDAAVAKYRYILEEEFTDVRDANALDQMTENFQKAVRGLVEEHYANRLRKQFNKMYQTWDEFPLADRPGKNDPPLDKQLYDHLFELMRTKMAGPGKPAEVEPVKPKAKPAAS